MTTQETKGETQWDTYLGIPQGNIKRDTPSVQPFLEQKGHKKGRLARP